MKAIEIHIEEIVCDDAGIQEHGHSLIPTDCLPSKGDILWLEGVKFHCTHKEIRLDHGSAYITLHLKSEVTK
jgi:hypothetical protein